MRKWFLLYFVFFTSNGLFGQNIFNDITEGNIEAVIEWLHKGKDLDILMVKTNEFGDEGEFDVFSWAAVKNQPEIIYALAEEKDKFTEYTEYISKALGASIQFGDMELILFLVEQGADVNYQCQFCNDAPPIAIALAYNNFEIFHFLKTMNASLKPTGGGYDAIHTVVQLDSIEFVKDFVSQQIEYINFETSAGLTPLMFAISEGNLDVMNYLVLNGANIDAVDTFGLGILHYAAISGDLQKFKWAEEQLIQHNREILNQQPSVFSEIINSDNKELFDYYISNYSNKNLTIMDFNGDPPFFALLWITDNTAYILDKLIQLKVDLSATGDTGITLYKAAKKLKNKDLVKLLKNRGVGK